MLSWDTSQIDYCINLKRNIRKISGKNTQKAKLVRIVLGMLVKQVKFCLVKTTGCNSLLQRKILAFGTQKGWHDVYDGNEPRN